MTMGNRITEVYNGQVKTRVPLPIVRQRVHWICDHATGPDIIDIGCSQGICSMILARESNRVLAIDTDPEAISFAQKSLALESPTTRDNIIFQCISLYDDSLAENDFDTVIMGEVLEHLADPARAVVRAYQLVKPGGNLIITVPFGFGLGKLHHQTFYITGIYKLMASHFMIRSIEIIGEWLCLAATKRSQVIDRPDKIEMWIVDIIDQGFFNREVELLETARQRETIITQKFQDHIGKLQYQVAKIKRSWSYRIGNIIIRAAMLPIKPLRG